jgi:hypothetical protein
MQTINVPELFNSMIFVYSNIFSNFTLEAILAQMQLIMLIKTVHFILTAFLPIDGLIQTLFSPFVYVHQIFHAHAAKKLNNKYKSDSGYNPGLIRMATSLGYSTYRKSEYSNISFLCQIAPF